MNTRANRYRLKRDYGFPVTVVKLLDSTTDPRTGEKQETTQATDIPRVVALPEDSSRDYHSQPPSLNDIGERQFLIDRDDYASELTASDWLVYAGNRYQVASAELNEVGWLAVTTRRIE